MFTKLYQKEAVIIRESTKETRELILKSAMDIFLETGYQEASMRKIAARAGITAGAIYKHFPVKKKCLESSFMHAAKNLCALQNL